jgi:serine/threonine-protein kinase
MPAEQLEATSPIDRRVDVYAAGVVMWDALTGRRLFEGLEVAALVKRILNDDPPALAKVKPDLPPALDGVVMRALARSRDDRYPTALAFAQAIEKILPPIPMREVAEWVARVGDETLRTRADLVSKTEKISLPPPADGRASYPDTVGGVLSLRANRPDPPAPDTSGTTTLVDPIRRDPTTPTKRFPAFFVAGGVLVSIVFLAIALRVFSKKEPQPQPQPAPVASVAPQASETPAPAASSSAPPVVAPVDEALAPSVKPSAAPAHTAPVVRTAAPRRSCDPPWTVDARGVRVLKRECL